MKEKILLTLILLTITNFLFAQNFGSVVTQWYYSEHAGGSAPTNSEYLHFQSVADTVIEGITTHKIDINYYKYNGETEAFAPLYVYEHSDTVFMFDLQKEKFQTIYIFNAEKGDTITLDVPPGSGTADGTYRLVIDDIETVTVDGVSLKKYKTIALDEFHFQGDYFMDRVGGLDWFFPRGITIPEAGGPLRCYSDNQIDLNFQSIDCDFRLVNSINGMNNDFHVHVFPNPFLTKLSIQSNQPIERVEIFDLMNRNILSSSQLELNLDQVGNGVYLLVIYFKSGQRIEKKIIKNDL